MQAGIDSLALLHQAESTHASAEQKTSMTAQRIESVRVQLAVLLGQGPDRGLSIERPGRLNAAELALPENLPAELLGRRPDIVAARWRVEAARRNINAAKTQFYPNINLTAVFGVMAANSSDLSSRAAASGWRHRPFRYRSLKVAVYAPTLPGGMRTTIWRSPSTTRH